MKLISNIILVVYLLTVFYPTQVAADAGVINSPVFKALPHEKTGIEFSNHLPETHQLNLYHYQYYYNGAGVSLLDFNNDGLMDIFFVGNILPNKLYKNLGELKFEDVSQKAGIEGGMGWSTGSTIVDINADGWVDIYVTRSGQFEPPNRTNQLFVNNKDGTFSEQAKKYGIADPGYGTQASFFDYDLDGDLDLYVLNHSVQPDRELVKSGFKIDRKKHKAFVGDTFYRNDSGRFTEIGKSAGILSHKLGYGLGLGVGDLNNDGWPDIYIANDFYEHDYLYINNQKGGFRENLKNHFGNISQFSMGVDIADFNNDMLLDIAVADMAPADNYRQKTMMKSMNYKLYWHLVDLGYHHQYMFNTLQLNNGLFDKKSNNQNWRFSEIAQLSGVANTDWSWSPLFADLNNDGFKDLFVTNGRRKEDTNVDFLKRRLAFGLKARSDPSIFEKKEFLDLLSTMPESKLENFLFKNEGGLRFSNVSKEWGVGEPSNSTGSAYGDLDNDGDLDLVVSNVDQKSAVFENISKQQNNYLRVRLHGYSDNSLGIGAKVEIQTSNGQQFLEQQPSRGYQSSVEPVLHFGLGKIPTIDSLLITWPDGKQQELKGIGVNQVLNLKHSEAKSITKPSSSGRKSFLKEVSIPGTPRHKELVIDDYAKELLLPHKHSQLGPIIEVADVNADGLDDYFFAGARGKSSSVYIQKKEGGFLKKSLSLTLSLEGLGGEFFDFDGDGDLDLYTTNGGSDYNEGDLELQDRLFQNDGAGNFKALSGVLPKMRTSTMVAKAADFDGDGDQDLFVGGRVIPGKYPFPPRSYLLENRDGHLFDVTKSKAPGLKNIGMITDAKWVRIGESSLPNLILSGEWMPITFFRNNNGKLDEATQQMGLSQSNGWWYSLESADFDGDGDEDLVAGNLGLNSKYKASAEDPFQVHASDFDSTGSIDIVLSYRDQGQYFPVRGRECSSQQMPFIKEKFESYHDFGLAKLSDIFSQEALGKSLNYSAYTFASSYFENRNGKFFAKELPLVAQFSTVNGIVVDDFNRDGLPDLLLAGNRYETEAETPRNDASLGVLLVGTGKGEFKEVAASKSGFFAAGNIKSLNILKQTKGMGSLIIVGRNDGKVSFFSDK